MKRVAIVIGTRPEAIKLIPVYWALRGSGRAEVFIISTGQHKEMVNQIFSFFDVVPEVELSLMEPDQSLARLSALLFENLDKAFKHLAPDFLLVQGDTTSAMIGALVAFYLKIPVGHVEAGLRSFDKFQPFPEEINRRVISQVGDIHFAPTQTAYNNLENEKVGSAHVVGNTVIDALCFAQKKVLEEETAFMERFDFIDFKQKIVLITAHRRESFGRSFVQICQAIRKLSVQHPTMEFVFPVHLNPNVQNPVKQYLTGLANVYLISPLPYNEMVFLMCKSYIILTDSGGIQEEAPSLNVPVIVLRDVTERPEGVEAGCAVLAGTDENTIMEIFNSIHEDPEKYRGMQRAVNPYGDGMSADKIARIITRFLVSSSSLPLSR